MGPVTDDTRRHIGLVLGALPSLLAHASGSLMSQDREQTDRLMAAADAITCIQHDLADAGIPVQRRTLDEAADVVTDYEDRLRVMLADQRDLRAAVVA